jgi:hypothetical protein
MFGIFLSWKFYNSGIFLQDFIVIQLIKKFLVMEHKSLSPPSLKPVIKSLFIPFPSISLNRTFL